MESTSWAPPPPSLLVFPGPASGWLEPHAATAIEHNAAAVKFFMDDPPPRMGLECDEFTPLLRRHQAQHRPLLRVVSPHDPRRSCPTDVSIPPNRSLNRP